MKGYPLADLHDQVVEEAEANGLHAVDLAPAFSESQQKLGEKVFRDFLHPNASGQAIAATALAKWLGEAGVLPEAGIDPSALLEDSDSGLVLESSP